MFLSLDKDKLDLIEQALLARIHSKLKKNQPIKAEVEVLDDISRPYIPKK